MGNLQRRICFTIQCQTLGKEHAGFSASPQTDAIFGSRAFFHADWKDFDGVQCRPPFGRDPTVVWMRSSVGGVEKVVHQFFSFVRHLTNEDTF